VAVIGSRWPPDPQALSAIAGNPFDAPGHEEFFRGRTLTAVDAAVIVIDAAKRIESPSVTIAREMAGRARTTRRSSARRSGI
jgi:hypothetical protein